ncbi:acyltransferase family protein [Kocuria rosea]|uniref:acyltransferase family protein n=1 Tax=Kocuria rosea TaxID=1275 RepID=UPI00119E9EEA|nr:acyltransferase family protein [Kocuria rosea]
MRSTPRSGAIDAVRVLGIVAVVTGHVWANEFISKGLYSWHVPLFFFLTGYLWKPGRALVAEFHNRFRTLVKPYLFWLFVILALWVAVNYVKSDLTLGDVAHPLYGGFFATRPFSAFWFVTVLFFAAMAYRALERVPVAARWSIFLGGLLAGYLVGDLLARTPLSAGSAWPCLSFLALGGLFRRIEPRFGVPFATGVSLLLGSSALIVMGWSAPLDIKQGDYGTPVLGVAVSVGICAGLVLVAKAIFAHVPAGVNRAITVLAQAGFVVILSHAVALLVLGTTSAGGANDFLITLVAPWGLGLILLRTRLSPWATGIDRPAGSALHPHDAPASPATDRTMGS